MNCQHVSQLIDSGRFVALTEAERREGEVHSLGCARCLPLWLTHAHVAATSIPPMPPELMARWRSAGAVRGPVAVKGAASGRPMIVIASLVALAAAACMLIVNVADAPVSQVPVVVSVPPAVTTPVESVQTLESVALEPEESATPSVPARPVPLVPVPLSDDEAFTARESLALQKIVELHPEVVQGPETEDIFMATIILRRDGQVLSHALQTATRETARTVREELAKSMPADGGETIGSMTPKGRRLSDGRTLRGRLSFQHLTVSNDYDLSRSNLRVQDIMRANHADLMLPAGSESANLLTVFLTQDGKVQRQVVEVLGKEELLRRLQSGDVDTVVRATDLAGKLGIGADQIGLMGLAPVRDTTNARTLYVAYAWSRRAGESAPVFRQGGQDPNEGIDTAAALVLVERVMPHAFMPPEAERSLGQDVVVFTQEGEVVRTGFRKPTGPPNQLEQLVPGLVVASARTVLLTNSKGEKTSVYFVWQASPAQKAEMEKSSAAAPGR